MNRIPSEKRLNVAKHRFDTVNIEENIADVGTCVYADIPVSAAIENKTIK